MRARGWAVGAWIVAAAASRASALDAAEGRLTVSGFGEWGYGRTTSDSDYVFGSERGEYGHAQFSLAVTARASDEVVVAGQVFLVADGEAALDWAFAEYRVSDLLRIRAGKVKNPLGLFMEVKDVGTLRPFFFLPQSIYGPGNFGAEAYTGAGITGAWESSRGWGVDYDLYGGALSIPNYDPVEARAAAVPPYEFGAIAVVDQEARDVVGGRVTLHTPLDGLTVRISGFTGRMFEEDRAQYDRIAVYGVSAEYVGERFQVRGEMFRQTEADVEENVAEYVEAAWSPWPKVQLAVRAERGQQRLDGVPDSDPLLRHVEGAVGLAWWPSPDLAFKLSYHVVDGNRFALPALSAADGSVERRTSLVVAGAQFSF